MYPHFLARHSITFTVALMLAAPVAVTSPAALLRKRRLPTTSLPSKSKMLSTLSMSSKECVSMSPSQRVS